MDSSKLKRKLASYTVVSLLCLAALAASYFRILDNYELETLDIRFKLRPDLPVNKNIVLIEIGDDTIDKLGKWPISRRYHATLIDALTKAGAEAIIFDVFFSEEMDRESDESFSKALEKSGRVYLPYVFNISWKGGREVPAADRLQEKIIEGFKKFARGTGFINIIPDSDGKFRRIPPFIRFEGALFPHVCLLVAADYMGLKKEDIKVVPEKYVRLGKNIKIPLDSNSSIIVNFPGKWDSTFRHYSYIDILESYLSSAFPIAIGKKPIVEMSSFKGSVCFVGVTATATPDAHPTPFDALYPGVGVNASLFNSILINKFINRATKTTNIIVLILLCAVTCFIAKRAKTLLSFLFIFLFITGYAGVAIACFTLWGIWLDIFCPAAVIFLLYLGLTFSKYINETHKIELLERELSIAKKIQESFLPKENMHIPGVELAAKMIMAKQVGGDLYDFVALGGKKFGVMIGDVSGKGMPAALYMAKVVSEFKSYANEISASRAIAKLNTQLCEESGSGLFVTLSYMIFDTEKGTLNYSTGGHLPMIMLSFSGDLKLIDIKEGMPLGLFEGGYGEENIGYKKGDYFVLYTDGVTEAMNQKGEMFGEKRLTDLVGSNRDLSAEGMVGLIQKEVKAFEGRKRQHDDITVVAAKVI